MFRLASRARLRAEVTDFRQDATERRARGGVFSLDAYAFDVKVSVIPEVVDEKREISAFRRKNHCKTDSDTVRAPGRDKSASDALISLG